MDHGRETGDEKVVFRATTGTAGGEAVTGGGTPQKSCTLSAVMRGLFHLCFDCLLDCLAWLAVTAAGACLCLTWLALVGGLCLIVLAWLAVTGEAPGLGSRGLLERGASRRAGRDHPPRRRQNNEGGASAGPAEERRRGIGGARERCLTVEKLNP